MTNALHRNFEADLQALTRKLGDAELSGNHNAIIAVEAEIAAVERERRIKDAGAKRAAELAREQAMRDEHDRFRQRLAQYQERAAAEKALARKLHILAGEKGEAVKELHRLTAANHMLASDILGKPPATANQQGTFDLYLANHELLSGGVLRGYGAGDKNMTSLPDAVAHGIDGAMNEIERHAKTHGISLEGEG